MLWNGGQGAGKRRSWEIIHSCANFEENCSDVEETRLIYEDALNPEPKGCQYKDLNEKFELFKKVSGDEDGKVMIWRTPFQDDVQNNQRNYKSWFTISYSKRVSGKYLISERYLRQLLQMFQKLMRKKSWEQYVVFLSTYTLHEEFDLQNICEAIDVFLKSVWS